MWIHMLVQYTLYEQEYWDTPVFQVLGLLLPVPQSKCFSFFDNALLLALWTQFEHAGIAPFYSSMTVPCA